MDLLDNQRANEQIDRRQTEKELLDVINLKKYEIDILHQVSNYPKKQIHALEQNWHYCNANWASITKPYCTSWSR